MSDIQLAGFFLLKQEQENQFAVELKIKAKQLYNLIPHVIRGYTDEVMFYMDKWLLDLYSNTKKGSCNSDKIKNLSDYEFISEEDAKSKLALLQVAWKDEVDVKIIEDTNYIKVEFRMIGIVK